MGELVIACGDPAKIFKSAETSFDNVAFFVELFVMTDFLFAVGTSRDNGLDAELSKKGAELVTVIPFICQQLLDARHKTDTSFGL